MLSLLVCPSARRFANALDRLQLLALGMGQISTVTYRTHTLVSDDAIKVAALGKCERVL